MARIQLCLILLAFVTNGSYAASLASPIRKRTASVQVVSDNETDVSEGVAGSQPATSPIRKHKASGQIAADGAFDVQDSVVDSKPPSVVGKGQTQDHMEINANGNWEISPDGLYDSTPKLSASYQKSVFSQPAVTSVAFEKCFDLATGQPVKDDPMMMMMMQCPATSIKFPYGGGDPHARTWWSEAEGTRAALVPKSFESVTYADISTASFCGHINDDSCGTNWDDPSLVGVDTMILQSYPGTYWKVGFVSETSSEVKFEFSPLAGPDITTTSTTSYEPS